MNLTVIGAVLGVIASIVAIVSFVDSIIRNRKANSKKEFSFRYSYYKLVRKSSANYSKISVLFDGKSIDDVSITKYAIWNSGSSTIEKNDIPPGGEIRISTGDSDSLLLDVNIIAVTNEVNAFSVMNINENESKIGFEYVNPNDGVLLEVLHTGSSNNLSIKCDIKGSKGINKKGLISNLAFAPSHSKTLGINALLLMPTMVVADAMYILESFFGYEIPDTITGTAFEKYFGLILILIVTLMCFALSITVLKRNYFTGIPNALKEKM